MQYYFHQTTSMTLNVLIFGVLLSAMVQAVPVPVYYYPERGEVPPTIDDYVQLLRKTYDLQRKRGLDFGFHRGHSGMMTAKYLAGLEMAGPMGPGRKRSTDDALYEYEPNDATSYPNELNPYIDNRQWVVPQTSNLDLLYKQGNGLKHSEGKEANGAGRRLRRSLLQETH